MFKFKGQAMSWVFILFFLTVSLSHSVHANIGESFGFGSRIAALGGAGIAGNAGAFSAYHNPAELGLLNTDPDKRLQLSYGILYMEPHFRPITNVVTQNKFNADAVAYGDVDTQYRHTLGQEIGLSFRLFPEVNNLTLGITSFFPIDAIAYMDSGEAYIPEYVLYRARTQRPQVEVGIGADLGNGFHLGAGLHFGFTLTGNGSVFINTRTGTTSSMRFTSSLKPKAAPHFGLLYTKKDDPELFGMGIVLRLPVTSDNTMVLNSAARVFGDFAAVDFNFTAVSALFYDPLALEWGTSWKHSHWGKVFGQIDYQMWSKFESPALVIQQPQTTQCRNQDGSPCNTVQIAPGKSPSYQYADILVPRLGEEIYLSDLATLRLGYAYRPSILKDISNGEGNYLDPPKHMLSLGLGLNYKKFLGYSVPTHLDFHLAYHYLMIQHIVKTPGNEGSPSDPNDPKIGSPGYDAGGNLLGGGVSLSFNF